MASVTVLGSLNVDLVTSVPRLPGRGETISGTRLARLAGGKGANQAVAARLAGASVRMVGACGDDESGTLVLTALHEAGVDTRLVRRVRGVTTGTAVVLVEERGENMIAITAGANDHVSHLDVRAGCDDVARGDVLLLQLEVPARAVREAARLADERGATVVLNAAPATGEVGDLLAHVQVLVVNEHEVRQLAVTYRLVTAGADVAECARALARYGDCLVITTLGHDGALATRGDNPSLFPAPQVQVVDTVGAGDAFAGHLAAALCQGVAEDEAISAAVRAASLAVTRPGAQASVPPHEEVPAVASQGES